jgi:hypothetical protein
MPEQEFRPPRRPFGSGRPPKSADPLDPLTPLDRDDEDLPPWADMPSIRPSIPSRPSNPGRPGGRHAGPPGDPAGSGYGDPAGPADLRDDEPEPSWALPETPDDDDAPRAKPREPGRRALAAAARKRRRWVIMAAAVVVVAGAVIATVLLTGGRPAPAAVTPGSLITTFQPGELRQVPSACQAVPAATVQQYLPGKVKQAVPLAVNGAAESACNWTVDQPPVYRLMELNMLAYAPNGLASGDGSATYAAIDAYAQTLADTRNPPKGSPDPRAPVTTLSGLGNQAFSVLQVFREGGAVTDVATVMVRYHNVLVTVTLDGLEHSNKGSYGPVSGSQLSAAALAFARAAEAALQ